MSAPRRGNFYLLKGSKMNNTDEQYEALVQDINILLGTFVGSLKILHELDFSEQANTLERESIPYLRDIKSIIVEMSSNFCNETPEEFLEVFNEIEGGTFSD